VLGVLPADEGLGADDITAADVDFGLVVQNELIVLQCPAQVSEQHELGRGVPVDVAHPERGVQGRLELGGDGGRVGYGGDGGE